MHLLLELVQLLEKENQSSLSFKSDIPNKDWLNSKREYAKEDGLNRFGAPKTFGATTGWFSRNVLLPVNVLSKLKGLSGEHKPEATRKESLDWLTAEMSAKNHLPLLPHDNTRQYVPYVMVWQDGTPYINEGNHRIKAAVKLGWKYLPIELKYFNGGQLEDGPLTPDKVKNYDSQALNDEYAFDSSFRGSKH